MRLLPRLAQKRVLGGRCLVGVVEPAVPFSTNAAGFGLAVEHHPPALVILGAEKDVALLILADLHAFAPAPELGVQRRSVPPCDGTQNCPEDSHTALRPSLPRLWRKPS